MGKNSKKIKASKKIGVPNNKGVQSAPQGNIGNTKGAAKQAPKVVSLEELGTLTLTTVAEPVMRVRNVATKVEVQQSTPVIEPPQAPSATTSKDAFGYVLETNYSKEGRAKWTKVLTDMDGVIQVILYYMPAKVLDPGTLIKFIPGEHEGRMTVTEPAVYEKNTPLSRFFIHLLGARTAPEITQVTFESLAKEFLSVNHVGKDDADRVNNFLAAQGIIEVVTLLPNGSLLVKK